MRRGRESEEEDQKRKEEDQKRKDFRLSLLFEQ